MPYLEKGSETLIEKLLNRLETKSKFIIFFFYFIINF